MASEDPAVIKSNVSDVTTSFETTSNPRTEESFSVFGDDACGEPLLAQHLVIDFTPIEELDNDFVQRKCCAFWDYISNQAELQRLMVLPESILYPEKSELNASLSNMDESETHYKSIKNDRTAVSMLEFVEEKGLIDRTFEARLPQSQCTLGSREYHEDSTTSLGTSSTKHISACSCDGACGRCTKPPGGGDMPTPKSTPEVKSMCEKMRQWDSEHPKSMEPPGHPPALTHCIIQRKIIY